MLDLLMPRNLSLTGQVAIDSDAGWSGGSGSLVSTRAGVDVNGEIALTYEAVFRATCVLAEPISFVPLPCYERTSQYDRNIANLSVADLLKFMANEKTPAGVFREGRVAHQVNWGSGFAEIERDSQNRAVALWPIHPSRVERSQDPEFAYVVRNNNGTPTYLRSDEMLHIPGALSDDGIWGRGVIAYGAECIGTGLATEGSVQSHFASGGQPKGIFEAPGMNDRTKRREFRREWEEVHGNPKKNAPTIAVVNTGSKYTPISLTNEANQLIQTRQVNKSNIATLYGIPGYKLNAEGKETAGTIEQKAIEFVVYSLLPWARKFEEQCNFKLLTPLERERFYFEHNFSALLRGDQASRYNAYRIAFSIGVMSINEIRRLENLPSIGESGDQYFVPANMTTTERALVGDMGNGNGIGSDTTGSPADNPNDSQAAVLVSNAMKSDFRPALTQLERDLPVRSAEWRGVARQVLRDAIKGLMVRESNAVKQASKSNDFYAKIGEFYSTQTLHAIESLSSACSAMRLAGAVKDRTELAEWLVAQSKKEALEAYESDSRESFTARISAWPSDRTERLVQEIMGE